MLEAHRFISRYSQLEGSHPKPQNNEFLWFLAHENGILPEVILENSGLAQRLEDFVKGVKPVMLVGGEPASGKSLIASEIIRLQSSYERDKLYIKTARQPRGLAVISWDRFRKLFFDSVSLQKPFDVPPPIKATPEPVLQLMSKVLGDLTRFAWDYLPKDWNILVEAPMFGNRGESMMPALQLNGVPFQVLYVHSPGTQEKVMTEGRNSRLSANPNQITSLHRYRLASLGLSGNFTSFEEHAELLKADWQNRLKGFDGMIVEWDARKLPEQIKFSKEILGDSGVILEVISPASLVQYVATVSGIVQGYSPHMKKFMRETEEQIRNIPGY